MQEKRHDRVVEMRLCFFLGKVGDYNVSFVETRMCRSTGLHFSYAIFNCHAYSKIIQKISWNRLKTSFFRLLLSVL